MQIDKVMETSASSTGRSSARIIDAYDPSVYDRLNRFHVAKDELADQHDKIVGLGRVIRAHGLDQLVGVNLLHKHFDLLDDEVLVRTFASNRARIEPKDTGRLGPLDLPYLWQWTNGASGAGFYPLEFATCNQADADAVVADVARIAANAAFLDDMASKIAELDVADVFGIATLSGRDMFMLGEGETVVETTDEEQRLLSIDPIDDAALDREESTQTLWVFSGSQTGGAISKEPDDA